jgi:hypothetical protein
MHINKQNVVILQNYNLICTALLSKKYKYQEIFILSTFLGLSSGALERGCVRGAMVRMYRIFGHSLVRNWIRNKVLESGGCWSMCLGPCG